MHDDDSSSIEAIDFSSLSKKSDSDTIKLKKSSSNKSIVWLLLLFVLISGSVVFIFLPKYVEEQKTTKQPVKQAEELADKTPVVQTPVEEKPSKPALSAEQLNAFKEQAESLLLEIIGLQEELEQRAVKQWAAEEYKLAAATSTRGDELFRIQNYPEAISVYEQAILELTAIQERVQPILEEHLQLGELSLTQGDEETSRYHFELAIAIDAHNQQATNGLKRSQTIKELFELLQKGGSLEAANRLQSAHQTYKQAVELDQLSKEAQNALTRVENRLTDIEFSRLMASGYSLLEMDRYQDSKAAFMAAQKLKPSSDKPKQGINKVNQAIREEKITALFVEAQHFESNEEWNFAAESYKQILALASNSAKAAIGFEQSNKRAVVLEKLNKYVNNHSRLYSAEVSAEANLFIQEAELLDQPGQKITQQISRLKELLVKVRQPVEITLLSDNHTDVVIYKIAKLGQFENHKITLKPGKYTIVGSRPGYRDVRKNVTVRLDMQSKSISVKCEEQI